jgi:hypothetical protein
MGAGTVESPKMFEKSPWRAGFSAHGGCRDAILRVMTTRSTARGACVLAVAALLCGCAKMAANDRYTPPPNDGSVPANSEDVTDNPPIVPN